MTEKSEVVLIEMEATNLQPHQASLKGHWDKLLPSQTRTGPEVSSRHLSLLSLFGPKVSEN